MRELGTQVNISIAVHTQINCQSECTSYISEDMLGDYVLDFEDYWEQYLTLTEFMYIKSYYSNIQKVLF